MDLYAGAIMCERGEIQNEKRAKQLNNFSNLRYGKITPTDIDGCIEYQDKCYVFFEIKYRDKKLPYGQRLALERITRDLSKSKYTLAIIAEHCIDDPNKQINADECQVREIFFLRDKWQHVLPGQDKSKTTVKNLLNWFLKNYGGYIEEAG